MTASTPAHLGNSLRDVSLNNLLKVLATFRSSENLLVIDQELSNLINHLTPFSKLKQSANFDKIMWFSSLVQDDSESPLWALFNSLIVVLSPLTENLQKFSQFITTTSKQFPKLRLNVVYANLSRNYLFELSSMLSHTVVKFDNIMTKNIVNGFKIKVTPAVLVANWEVTPLEIEDGVVSVNLELGGLDSYFNVPLQQVSVLSDPVLKLMEIVAADKASVNNFMKIKNIYSKGDHAKLFTKMVETEKLPQFLNERLTNMEQDFYTNKMQGNTDLVVLERNLDWLPLLMNQLNYQGLIDDLFCIGDEFNRTVTIDEETFKLNDELYDNLKDLNFGSIGLKLNKLAKLIQSQFQKKDNLTDLKEIRMLVNNLGNLTNKQDLVKKHTSISESVLKYIQGGLPNSEEVKKYDQHEFYLQFQNDVFDLDYKAQINYIIRFLDENMDQSIVISLLVLVSLINDGIKEKDFDLIQNECVQNYGVDAILILEKLTDFNLINVIPTGNADFLGALTGLSLGNNAPTPSPGPKTVYDDLSLVGVTGAQNVNISNYTLINKFWNLHPVVEEEYEEEKPVKKDDELNLLDEYPHGSFALPSNTVPLICRLVESLYFRDFLKYKPVNNIQRRSNWDNLGLDNMLKGKTVDINICDDLNEKRGNDTTRQEYILVVLLGGITRSEISVFKYLQQKLTQHGHKKKLIVLTSGVVSNRKMMKVLRQ